MVQQKQLSGTPTDDPNLYLSISLESCDTLKMNGVTYDTIRLRLFPFPLRDRARAWLHSLPSESITTWDQLKQAFLGRYFPPSKTAQLRNQITSFSQKEGESLYEAWENFKEMLRLCPHHGMERWLIIHTFYNELSYTTRMTVDDDAGGAFINKNIEESYALIEDMEHNHYQWSSDRSPHNKGGMYEVDALDHIASKVDALFQKFEKMNVNDVTPNVSPCEICGTIGHVAVECQVGMFVNSGVEEPKDSDVEANIRDDSEKTQPSSERIDEEKENPYVPLAPYKPPIPFPQRFAKAKIEEQFRKKLDNHEAVALTEECSAIIQNKLSSKLKDPGSFSIPCVIGDMSFECALCDLGASVSLMPLSVCKKLDVGKLKPTHVSLQLVNRSIKYPVGILEDVSIKVGQLFIPADFVVLEMEEDSQVPILLGRHFLATTGAIIDVKNGKLVFNVSDEKIEFNLSNLMKNPSLEDSYCRVDLIDHCVKECPLGPLSQDGLEACLIGSTSHEDLAKEADAYANLLEENPPLPNLNFEALLAENSTHLPKEAP
ncbi:uncharacterized protein [Cicer arietinum]|uniref:uncharacterized protein n=1 Tax=Cicer arietinum TaxID=3827 RepID=UPI00032A7999